MFSGKLAASIFRAIREAPINDPILLILFRFFSLFSIRGGEEEWVNSPLSDGLFFSFIEKLSLARNRRFNLLSDKLKQYMFFYANYLIVTRNRAANSISRAVARRRREKRVRIRALELLDK